MHARHRCLNIEAPYLEAVLSRLQVDVRRVELDIP
jgi:hypothetical protein